MEGGTYQARRGVSDMHGSARNNNISILSNANRTSNSGGVGNSVGGTSSTTAGAAAAAAASSYASSDPSRMNLYKNIKNKFYLHKSFDHQSDLEFCPAIAFDPSISGSLSSPNSSPNFQYRNSDYYGNGINSTSMHQSTSIHGGANGSHGSYEASTTPRSRIDHVHANPSSPRRTPPNTNNMRTRRAVSNNQQHASQGISSPAASQYNNAANVNYDQSYLMQNRVTQYANRNW